MNAENKKNLFSFLKLLILEQGKYFFLESVLLKFTCWNDLVIVIVSRFLFFIWPYDCYKILEKIKMEGAERSICQKATRNTFAKLRNSRLIWNMFLRVSGEKVKKRNKGRKGRKKIEREKVRIRGVGKVHLEINRRLR